MHCSGLYLECALMFLRDLKKMGSVCVCVYTHMYECVLRPERNGSIFPQPAVLHLMYPVKVSELELWAGLG